MRMMRAWIGYRTCSRISSRCDLRSLAVTLVSVTHLSCGATSPDWGKNPDPPATSKEISAWRSERGFVAAGVGEVEEAARREKRFVKSRSVSPDGTLRVVFRCGELVGSAYQGTSTTSTYQLVDAKGRVLISAPSRICRMETGKPFMEPESAWFSPDASKVLVGEDTHANEGVLAILFFQDPENNGQWSVRFPDLGDTLNRPFDEGDRAECRGLLGEEILIRNTRDGVSKIRLDRLKERHPFPFTIG